MVGKVGAKALSDVFVRQLTVAKRTEIYDAKIAGLVLRVSPSGAKSFSLVTRDSAGKNFRMTLGQYPVVSIALAREMATEKLRMIAQGVDLREERRKTRGSIEASSLTLAALLDEAVQQFGRQKAVWRENARSGHPKPEAKAAIERVFSCLLLKPVDQISEDDIAKACKAYQPIRPRRGSQTANGAVSRALSYLGPVLDWAAGRGRFVKRGAGRQPRIAAPSTGEVQDPSLDDPMLVGKRERTLTQTELVSVLPVMTYPAPPGLRERLDPCQDYGPVAFRFLLLTLSRREEVANMRCGDVDRLAQTWRKTVKTLRKSGSRQAVGRREVVLPLSSAAMALLMSLPSFRYGKPEDYVFPSSAGGRLQNWNRTQEAIFRASGTAGWHRHDLRRTAATILNQLGVAVSVIDRHLCHVDPLSREGGAASAAHYIFDEQIIANTKDVARKAVDLLGMALGGLSGPCRIAAATANRRFV